MRLRLTALSILEKAVLRVSVAGVFLTESKAVFNFDFTTLLKAAFLALLLRAFFALERIGIGGDYKA
jgi:hypothetical protein